MDLMVFDEVEDVCRALTRKLVALAESDKLVTVALSGGSTPKWLFKMLSEEYADTDWSNVHFFWGDERCVAFDSSESNYGEAKRLFFDLCQVPEENIHAVDGSAEPEFEAQRYADEISVFTEVGNGFPVFDLVILGLGTDGHTASIFPDRGDLWFAEEICAAVKHPESGQERVTITGPVINNARVVVFLCTGAAKAKVVASIVRDEDTALPATKVCPVDGELVWFMDRAASAGIENGN